MGFTNISIIDNAVSENCRSTRARDKIQVAKFKMSLTFG